jgi:endonuclease/exonuclease/phosphatase family metal-dependent hydrolase
MRKQVTRKLGKLGKPRNIKKVSINNKKLSKLTSNNHRHKRYTKHINQSQNPQKKKLLDLENTLKVLTYNISWESMTGEVSNWGLCSNNKDKNNPKHHSVCVRNIASVINENPTEFVCLQEATNYHLLFEKIPRLYKMKYKVHKSGFDQMVTFWNPSKYTIEKFKCGEFEINRPYMCLYFKEKICLVNVHFGHYKDKGELENMNKMIDYLELKKYYDNGYRVIIAGDFNNNIRNLSEKVKKKHLKLEVGGVKFNVIRQNLKTCWFNRNTHYDHVIDTLDVPIKIKIPKVADMASDHRPVLAYLQKKNTKLSYFKE